MKKQILFHGGEFTDNFAGWSWWTPHFSVAQEYGEEVYAVLIDRHREVFVDEDDKHVTEACQSAGNEAAWEEQAAQIANAQAAGATIYCSDDGWALDHTNRRIRRIY